MKKSWKPRNLEELSDDSHEVYHILDNESDLACVLIGTSFLSELLASALKSAFIKSKTSEKILNPNTGTIGGFTARADLAYCLGFIDKADYQDLIKLAEIRNLFAHKHHVFDFNNAEIQKDCEELRACRLFVPSKESDLPPKPSAEQLRIRARIQFNVSVVVLGTNIQANALSKKVKPTL